MWFKVNSDLLGAANPILGCTQFKNNPTGCISGDICICILLIIREVPALGTVIYNWGQIGVSRSAVKQSDQCVGSPLVCIFVFALLYSCIYIFVFALLYFEVSGQAVG